MRAELVAWEQSTVKGNILRDELKRAGGGARVSSGQLGAGLRPGGLGAPRLSTVPRRFSF